MMDMPIRKKLVLAFGAMVIVPVLLLSIVFFVTILVYGEGDRLTGSGNELERIEKRDRLFGELKLLTTAQPSRLEDPSYLKAMDSKLRAFEYGLLIRVDGKVHYADDRLKIQPFQEKLPPFGSFVNQVHNSVEIDGKPFKLRQHDFMLPDGREGSIFIVEESTAIEQFVQKHLRFILLLSLLVLILTNGVLSYIVSLGIIKPLKDLQQSARRIMEGDLDFQMASGRKDEIGDLIEDFEMMRGKLKDSVDRQIEYENERRLLLSNISHDLKTPISSIKGYVEGIRDGIADTEEKQSKYMSIIYKKANEMDALINELFLSSKLDLRQVPFHFEEIDLNAYVKDFAEEAAIELREKGIALVVEIDLSVRLYVKADREKLARVFNNVIQNSAKYINRKDGAILIEVVPDLEAGRAIVKIRDNGPGIGDEALPKVFDPFYRADSSRNNKNGGSGLGLTIAKQIVEGHAGKISVYSCFGNGTEIVIDIPIFQDEMALPEGEWNE